MFGISFTEFFIIATVALLVIDPKDLPKVVKTIKKWIKEIKSISEQMLSLASDDKNLGDLKSEAKKINQDIRTIIDLDGIPREAYDIDDIMPELNKSSKNKNNDHEI
ncbi:hypothetical protein N9W34_01385 [Rickettsiales bacterium]|nr:hypothetical protein [Rickettsiales bacterium]